MIGRSRKRHIAKSLTWRLVGTLDTVLISWIITGSPKMGAQIGFAEAVFKIFLYYLHERAWFAINLSKAGIIQESRIRHLLKTFTWRGIGTISTIALAWFITGSPKSGVKIGGIEFLTKMVLYYLHERVWYRTNYGLKD